VDAVVACRKTNGGLEPAGLPHARIFAGEVRKIIFGEISDGGKSARGDDAPMG
jgi:hypothetical protein